MNDHRDFGTGESPPFNIPSHCAVRLVDRVRVQLGRSHVLKNTGKLVRLVCSLNFAGKSFDPNIHIGIGPRHSACISADKLEQCVIEINRLRPVRHPLDHQICVTNLTAYEPHPRPSSSMSTLAKSGLKVYLPASLFLCLQLMNSVRSRRSSSAVCPKADIGKRESLPTAREILTHHHLEPKVLEFGPLGKHLGAQHLEESHQDADSQALHHLEHV